MTEGERVRVFATFDEVEKTFVFLPTATEEDIIRQITEEKNRLEEVASTISVLKKSLIDTEI